MVVYPSFSLYFVCNFVLTRGICYRAGKPLAGLHLDVTKNGNVVEVQLCLCYAMYSVISLVTILLFLVYSIIY